MSEDRNSVIICHKSIVLMCLKFYLTIKFYNLTMQKSRNKKPYATFVCTGLEMVI